MKRFSDDDLVRLLRDAVPAPPASDGPAPPWTRLRATLSVPRRRPSASEWVLAGAIVVVCAMQPSAIRVLLFHF